MNPKLGSQERGINNYSYFNPLKTLLIKYKYGYVLSINVIGYTYFLRHPRCIVQDSTHD